MKTYMIKVDHRDETGRYWADSSTTRATQNEGETIHEAIVRAIAEGDYCTFSYKGKPQGNVYRDQADGTSKVVGYHYRTKHYIENRSDNIQKDDVPFTTWVTFVGEIAPVELVDIEN